MPSFNAIDLGPFARIKTRAARVDLQITAYPGVNGLAATNLGSRGFVTEIDFACVGADAATLSAVITTFRSAQVAAAVGPLIDSFGDTWPDAVVVEFYPTDDVAAVPGYGLGQEFHMELLHLS